MKKSDLATIILIAGFSVIVAFILANTFLGDPSEESVSIRYLDVVSKDIAQPDPELFNTQAVNPTVEIVVGSCQEGEVWDSATGACVSDSPEEDTEDTGTEEDATDTDTEEEVSTDDITDQPSATEQ